MKFRQLPLWVPREIVSNIRNPRGIYRNLTHTSSKRKNLQYRRRICGYYISCQWVIGLIIEWVFCTLKMTTHASTRPSPNGWDSLPHHHHHLHHHLNHHHPLRPGEGEEESLQVLSPPPPHPPPHHPFHPSLPPSLLSPTPLTAPSLDGHRLRPDTFNGHSVDMHTVGY